jgi:flagellar protein FlaI
VAVRRGAAVLVAGPRGAGKTSTLEALLWELRPETRVVAVEDTPELGVEVLQRHGRDVQRVHAASDDDGLTPTDAVRTALRLGDGALVVGEVRGEEARALYEAMRVGASAHAVLGTVHGDGAAAVRERVVGDLGVAPLSFAATDLLVTLERTDATAGGRRVAGVTEVFADDDGVGTAALWADSHPTGRVDRGESRALTALADLGETYGDLRTAAADRADELAQRAEAGLTRPADVADVAPE